MSARIPIAHSSTFEGRFFPPAAKARPLRHATSEHTGLLRMGLEVGPSMVYWQRAKENEDGLAHRQRATEEGWFPELSPARLRYLMGELEKRFPAGTLRALKEWRPEAERQAPLVCHWHLQWSDPLYRDFTSGYLVGAWAGPEAGVSVPAVDSWLSQRGTHADWSPSTRRRLASGLLAAASDAGFLKGTGRDKELRTVTVDAASMAYLQSLLSSSEAENPPGEEIFLSGTVHTP